eukprot:TRINITY_DN13385_c0_g1_i3.p1 TRINITY_DN13385_c0_g1~~TRINITY_DN13385_c0_g1_i3.p1  ORF type:complete len:142 (+),score=23.97 TRINITY_DN13385_c0_g1_i3:279-704(+)
MHHLKLVDGSGEADGYYVRPLMNLPILVSHCLEDDTSPLCGISPEQWEAQGLQVVAIMEGIDPYTSNSMQLRKVYQPKDVIWGARFEEVVQRLPSGMAKVELSRFDHIRRDYVGPRRNSDPNSVQDRGSKIPKAAPKAPKE